ncbi:MAG: hypothetical protein SGBAC_013134 [Bacillariaceae sp.]
MSDADLQIYEKARSFHEQSFEHSERPDLTSQLPRVSLDGLEQTQVLGSGAFATVVAVRGSSLASLEQSPSVQKRSRQVSCASTQIMGEDDDEQQQQQQQEAVFALKQLKSSLDPEDLGRAIADLATEARLLAEVNHPHIVSLRAISTGPKFDRSFFLVIDRLQVSLKKRMDQWKAEYHRYSGLSGRLHDWNGQKRAALFQQRLCAARDLGSAFQYLHENRIVFRDLKQENVAFDNEGQIQLFDFGLAKELPALYHKDDRYNMTPHTGTLKYMAPEVALGLPYNESCDVYSFAILLWEMLSLNRAFASYTNKLLEEFVVRPPHRRPARNAKWPQELRDMMHNAWSPRISDRPSAKDMELMLMDLCLEDNLPTKRHSLVDHNNTSNNNSNCKSSSSSKNQHHHHHHYQLHKPKFHLFHHNKHTGQPHHQSHPRDTDDTSSSIHEEAEQSLSIIVR